MSESKATSSPRVAGVPWQHLFLPPEHGSWAFLAEPILLGLLVAFSQAGALIAVGAIALFLARQPLKLAAGDRRKGRRYPRTGVAERAFALLAMTAGAAFAVAVGWAGPTWLVAVGLAAPFGALAVALDLGQRSRALIAELVAPVALASVAAAIALAAGWARAPALALWGVLALRALTSILYVRARLRLDRGEPTPITATLATHIAAIAAAAWLAARHLTPWLAVAAIGLLALRAAHGLSRWRPRMTTRQLGLGELTFGLITVMSVAFGMGWWQP